MQESNFNSISYILDTREKGLQKLFVENKIPFQTRQLDLGDVLICKGVVNIDIDIEDEEKKNIEKEQIRNRDILLGQISPESNKFFSCEDKDEKKDNEKENKNESVVYTIERKSYTDLKASMSDGRYREQKSRYLKLPKGRMFYILECNDPHFKELDRKQYLGAYVNTMIRDSIPVFHTSSIEDTFHFIIRIGKCIEEFLDENGEVKSEGKEIEKTQIKKKKAKGSDVYLEQLCCFSGISMKKAQSIAEKYPNISTLIEAIKDNSFIVKGIGKKLIESIKDGLCLSNKEENDSVTFVYGEEKGNETELDSKKAKVDKTKTKTKSTRVKSKKNKIETDSVSVPMSDIVS